MTCSSTSWQCDQENPQTANSQTEKCRLYPCPELMEQASEKKRIYTDQDRLEFMMKKNPEVGQLKSRFGLDFDD